VYDSPDRLVLDWQVGTDWRYDPEVRREHGVTLVCGWCAGPRAHAPLKEAAMTYPTRRAGAQARSARLLVWAAVWAWLLAVPVGAAATRAGSESAPAPSAATAELRLALPAPTGSFAIGVRSQFLSDPSRVDPTTGSPRALPVRVWYPARDTVSRPTARYLSAAVQQVAEQVVGVPAGTFDVDTRAAIDTPMGRHIRGVILVSPGLGNLVAFSTAQVIDLASRGWVLVTFEHPHDTYVVEQPDGTLIFSDPADTEAHIEAAFAQRVLDVGVVLDHLSELVPGVRPATPVGMFGHSLGGAAAAEAMLRYPRLRAGVNLDGRPFGRVVQEGLDEPFGIMLSHLPDQPRPPDANLDAFISHLRGPHPVEELAIAHNGFTDFVVFNPQASLTDPALGARLESFFATGVDNLAAGTAALAEQRSFLSAFMRRHLRSCHADATRAGHRGVDRADADRDLHTLPVGDGSGCNG
jgi:pimeloyl-ACP methyl ester carboxylesterase